MSSQRIFEIVNQIHLTLSNSSENKKPFNAIFQHAFHHRFELLDIVRQDQAETEFVTCLKEVRIGYSSDSSTQLLKRLERDLPDEINQSATQIFFTRLEAQLYNLKRIRKLPGQILRFEASDQGNTDNISCAAEKMLLLKPGCKVMLIYNKSDELRNGSSGVFVGVESESVLVEFKDIGITKPKRETWHKKSMIGEVVATRTQFPFIPMKEFVPGLIYVALTCVKKSAHLQVIGFKSSQFIPPSQDCISVCNVNDKLVQDHSCCRNVILTDDDIAVKESIRDEVMEDKTEEAMGEVTQVMDNILKSYFERGEPSELLIDLPTVYAVLADETSHDFVRTPQAGFNIRELLKGQRSEVVLSDFGREKNKLIDEMLAGGKDLDTMGKVMWCRSCQIIIEDSIDDVAEIHVSIRQWTLDTQSLFMLLSRSPDFLSDLKMFFEKKLSPVQSNVGTNLMIAVYKEVVSAVADRVRTVKSHAPILRNVKEMPSVGRAKIRYVGAWAVAKVHHKLLNYAKKFIATESLQTLMRLQKTSVYPDTLTVTEEGQFRSRGLIHIEDCAYKFFLDIKVLRVGQLNDTKLRASIDDAIAAVKENRPLIHKWNSCFPAEVPQEDIDILYKLIVERYMMAGAGQYLRDYRLAYRLKKSAERRKKVLEKKTAVEEMKGLVALSDIASDRSPSKVDSHQRLIEYMNKFGEANVHPVIHQAPDSKALPGLWGSGKPRSQDIQSKPWKCAHPCHEGQYCHSTFILFR
ncbi:predicted protein [Nematostella vectensis]|uniref:Uncharacterized protein n=1 Tax=Nematostella vectensis TaxID=45351 RepID=A7SGY7_NEMVE|nr:predicted protein [Nematostella vectensis]|eukprot:XP_001629060.1 predicted protein [Nematostella vectensis]